MLRVLNPKISLKKAVALNRITLGLFFFFSGIANYLNFSVKDGFYQTVLTQKLQLWGPFPLGWEGLGPLPDIIAVPYAFLLPLAEIVLGLLFALGLWIPQTGLILILMTLSIILAFGFIPAGTLFPNGAESFNKNLLFITLTWMCIAYELDTKRARARRTEERLHYQEYQNSRDL